MGLYSVGIMNRTRSGYGPLSSGGSGVILVLSLSHGTRLVAFSIAWTL